MREYPHFHTRTRRVPGSLPLALALLFLAAPLSLLAQVPSPSPSSSTPPPDLDAWLTANPKIAKAMVCEWEAGLVEYPKWSAPKKKRLQQCFAKAWSNEPSGLPDPPENAMASGETEYCKQGLSERDALNLYLQTVASSLAVEIRHDVPWSIREYKPDELAILFDSREMYGRNAPAPDQPPNSAIYQIRSNHAGHCLPAPPEVSLAFLKRQNLNALTARDTVSNLLDWCRGLAHYNGGNDTANMRNHWLYAGFPPESRIISGAVFQGAAPALHGKTFHFTAGCWGTTGFLRAVLRSVNIPVEQTVVGGHSLPHFPTLSAYLTHGDDPYNLNFRTLQPALKGSELLIDQARFAELFLSEKDQKLAAEKVGFRNRELAVKHLPIELLWRYADDLNQHKPHDQGKVFQELSHSFTLEQLEAGGLWIRMDARMSALGGPDKVNKLRSELMDSTINHKSDP